jgi:hypothetical protein
VSGGTHKGTGGIFDPLTTYSDDGRPGPADPTLAWFDRYLKHDVTVDTGPTVTAYDLGTKAWLAGSSWPPSGAHIEHLYLSGAPSGSVQSLNDGSLAAAVPSGTAAASDSYVYEPTTGVAETFSKWGTVAATPHVHLDQRIDENRDLTYTTEAIPEDGSLMLAGPMELHFWGMTDATDTDWVVKVTDVAPDGSSNLISSGYMRASHRQWDTMRSVPGEPWITNVPQPAVDPGVAVEYRIDVWGIFDTLGPGHRLRIDLSSADIPNHAPQPLPARNTVFHDAAHPSELMVTVR